MDDVLHVVEAADLLTPVGAYIRLSAMAAAESGGRAPSLLLESVEGGATRGRYSVIALLPDLVWICRDGAAAIDRAPGTAESRFVAETAPPLESLRRVHRESQMALPPGLPPMIAGLFGYLGYDMVRQMEHLPDAPPDDAGLPDGVMVRPRLFAVFDSVRDELVLAVPLRRGGAADQAEAARLIETARAALREPVREPRIELEPGFALGEPVSNFAPGAFEAAVRRAQDYIAAGDAFQIVPSQRFRVAFPLPPLALYRALRRINPAPFLFLIELDGFALVGSSPEILVRLRDGVVTVRPLAGTRPRGETDEEDRILEAELLADAKERAEHLMLIDLGRNDVGRVAELGSVTVPARFVIERYSHVMHISSTVEGRIRSDADAVDALAAAFPAGTLSGAPKIRAMEIIDELEPTRRGPYAGCVGYFTANGEMDTCIGLRMAVLRDGEMYVQAGCGVVADSVPALEEAETRHKARALFRAAEMAVAGAVEAGAA
ncbi:anthranilate synthase component I [Acidomonas methanolica]|uniref:Anthranilate synthase component 1 n=1 Tax=Acidomonas methanolica NBRC 104435 TaxID=1231351 RepID=A0A023D0P7_ACIMT|nr:anthranilate synthase component I [Acidomonas methanolica]TCS32338.1 anthranilate synthase component 1 [Acidomonas methanolica]GAJ27713.1 anthranilate/para-aminobenzoate synthase component I [Acidomonas methanolica NBRC 104435]GBQ47093.1 anthranilate synthase component I [Acidomonas methanolica]GEK97775.1 anthranilate synthase component I [Acidomonas methanolica NBRC 104435]